MLINVFPNIDTIQLALHVIVGFAPGKKVHIQHRDHKTGLRQYICKGNASNTELYPVSCKIRRGIWVPF